MTELMESINGLMDGLVLMGMALAVGGVAYALAVLRLSISPSPAVTSLGRETLRLASAAAVAVGGMRLVELLILKPMVFAEESGPLELAPLAQTQAFRFGLLSVALAALLGAGLAWLRRDVTDRPPWVLVCLLAAAVVVNEAWLTHAVSRVGRSGLLMAMTVAHMAGAALWAGGIMHLLLSWRHARGPQAAHLWPELVARFSRLGLAAMVLVVAPGLYLAVRYVGDWRGLVGTGYGSLLVAKLALFACVAVLAGLNHLAARRWRTSRISGPLMQRAPPYIEVEVAMAAALLFTAASLSSLPPAVDVIADRVAPEEMRLMFIPKIPHLSGPEIILWERPELTDPHTGEPGYEVNRSWDRFHHNMCGLFVMIAAALAFLGQLTQAPWTRHWPLLFLAFGTYFFIFGDPSYFPVGEVGFVESVQSPGVLQHWFLAAMMAGVGWFEWRTRQEGFTRLRWRYLFPLVCLASGIILLAHSHSLYRLRTEYLTLATHVAIGAVVVIAGCARWLELRSSPPVERIAGLVASGALLLVGAILLFYVDPEDGATWERLKKL